jgi:hypothetical protein
MKTPALNPFRSNPAFITAGLLAVLWTSTHLQGQVKCGLSPALVMADFKPGEPFEVSLEVSNGSTSPMPMRGVAMDYWYDHENKKIFAPPGTMPHSAATWIEFVPRSFVVAAHGSSKVKMMVTPPKDANGSFYAVAFLESKPELTEPAQNGRQAVFTNIRLGALVLLAAENSQKYSIAVSDIKTTRPAPNRSLEVSFFLRNDSNTHIFPESSLVIMDSQRHIAAKAQGEIKRFLPGQKDDLSIKWSGSLPAGSYSALLSLLYGKAQVCTKELQFMVQDPLGALAGSPKAEATSDGPAAGSQH